MLWVVYWCVVLLCNALVAWRWLHGPVSQVRKGMVLVDERLHPSASWEFDADIAILTHSTTIQPRYQAVIHCEIIRQAARVVAMDTERLRSGDRWAAGQGRAASHCRAALPAWRGVKAAVRG